MPIQAEGTWLRKDGDLGQWALCRDSHTNQHSEFTSSVTLPVSSKRVAA